MTVNSQSRLFLRLRVVNQGRSRTSRQDITFKILFSGEPKEIQYPRVPAAAGRRGS
ncbi:MAG: hypothetical protein LBT47_09545 [Deltaproteobacteria bacterium]|nr:hypothetical protein [Deltaproteobacteria bacterium]